MSLEEELDTEMRQALERNPNVLAYMTGEKQIEDVGTLRGVIDNLLTINIAHREAILRLAREIDTLRG